MMTALRDALRDRLSARTVGLTLAVFAGLHYLLGIPVTQLAASAAMGAVLGLADAAEDAYDLRSSLTHASLGAVAVVGGTALIALDGGPAWAAAAFLAVGLWFVLDAVQTARHEGLAADADDTDGREVYRDYVARRVHESIRERPRTRRELRDGLAADTADVDAAVRRLLERGAVVERGSELHDAPDPTRWERAREWLSGVARRIARPMALEFGGARTDDGDDDTETTPDGSPAGVASARTDGRDAGSERRGDGERERDAAK